MSHDPGLPGGPVPGAGQLRPFGDAALLAGTASSAEARRLGALLATDSSGLVREVVVGLRSVLVVTLATQGSLSDLQGVIESAWAQAGTVRSLPTALPGGPSASSRPPGEPVLIPVTFDGPDLADVASSCGLAPDQVADLLVGRELVVEMVGFSPGFAYLGSLPPTLVQVARRPTPRAVVPAGSVALAAGHAAVYPSASPGGWQLIGRTDRQLFDPTGPPYALLAPGATVRFVPTGVPRVHHEEGPPPGQGPVPNGPFLGAAAPSGVRSDRGAWQVLPDARPAFVVEDPGFLTLVQDGGRSGVAHLGVPRAGPADPVSHHLANLLVGNPPSWAALECTLQGPVLRARGPLAVAVVGSEPVVLVDGREVPAGHVLPVDPGQQLRVGSLRHGMRTYLAVAGGFEVPRVMGSPSTDVLSWTGPGILRRGDHLGAGHPRGPLRGYLRPTSPRTFPGTLTVRTLRVVPGPHPEWFPPDALDRLGSSLWVVEAESSRVGIRLRPLAGGPVLPRAPGELASHGVVPGALQAPPGGGLVALCVDHATTGGYPVPAVVITADHPVLGQLSPGDQVALVPVTFPEALAARTALDRWMASATVGRYPAPPT